MQVYLLYVTDFIFYNFLYLHRSGKNIFTNVPSSSGIYQYFNGSVRRLNVELPGIFLTLLGTDPVQSGSLSYPFGKKSNILLQVGDRKLLCSLQEETRNLQYYL